LTSFFVIICVSSSSFLSANKFDSFVRK